MSQDNRDRPSTLRATKDDGPSPMRSALIWAGAAAAIAILAGGGYYAWRTYAPSQPDAEMAAADLPYAGPLSQDDDLSADIAAADAEAEAAMIETSAPAPAPTRRARPADEPAEAVIGVRPASVATSGADVAESDEIVVPGVRRPNWSRMPSARRLSAYYPSRALERGREGEASLRCLVEGDGRLDCERLSEAPANAGFGIAALRVARTFRHAPERADGSDAAGTPVNLRVLFRLEEDRPRR
ncbi:MAG: TonB family protein [Alphaproteobacteria bacterium]|nr:TonB family protein [Alphaproteobacteria bacterium]